MHTAAVARFLHDLNLVTFGTADTDCFLEEAPSDPVDAVTIIALPGAATNSGDGYDMPDFQIIVRADGMGGEAREGYERSMDIRDELHGVTHETFGAGTVDETRVISVYAKTSQPVSLGKDSRGHHRWSVTYRAEVRHSTPLRA